MGALRRQNSRQDPPSGARMDGNNGNSLNLPIKPAGSEPAQGNPWWDEFQLGCCSSWIFQQRPSSDLAFEILGMGWKTKPQLRHLSPAQGALPGTGRIPGYFQKEIPLLCSDMDGRTPLCGSYHPEKPGKNGMLESSWAPFTLSKLCSVPGWIHPMDSGVPYKTIP